MTCTNNNAPGYFFDPTTVTVAGATATTTTCAPGLVGYATRRCLWNGPNSAAGVWENPVSFCQRTRQTRSLGLALAPLRTGRLIVAGPGPTFSCHHTAVTCAPLTAYNASFSSVLIGSSSGACLVGYAGTISSQCLLNSTSGSTAYFSAPSGTCTRTERLETTFRAGHAMM